MSQWFNQLRVGFFLGVRQLFRSSIWMNLLIIAIMTLTFLNLVVVPGILVGLIEGGNVTNKEQYTGNVILTTLDSKNDIENTSTILETLRSYDEVEIAHPRYLANARVEANYQSRRDFISEGNTIGAAIVGVDPEREEELTGISEFVLNGEYLSSDETGYILIGDFYLEKYSNFDDIFTPLQNVDVGSTVKLTYAGGSGSSIDELAVADQTSSLTGRSKEFIIKGVISSKVNDVTGRVFMTETDFRLLTGRQVLNAQEIAVMTDESVSDDEIKSRLVAAGFGRFAEVKTAIEAIPKFLDTIKDVMGTLGNMVGSIGIIVSAITVFVVIYINALVRRKYIGILKGIGITGGAIRIAYMTQALFYAIVGVGIGFALVYGFFVPLVNANPINFPFSDGIISAPLLGTSIRAGILFIVTVLAGFIPAWLIVRQNTLDSILGR